MQADVADAEERGVVLVLERAGLLHHREVQTGLLQLGDVLDRQVGQHALVARAAEDEAVDVDRLGQLGDRRAAVLVVLVVPRRVQFPAATTATALVFGEEPGQRGLAHAHELDIHLGHVHRHHRQAARILGRQHAALRGETDRRFQFASEHLQFDVATDLAAVGRRQCAGDSQRVGLVRLDMREAQDLAVVVQGPTAFLVAGGGVEGQQLVEVLGADQRPRELHRDRQGVAALVGISADHREAFDFIALGLDRLPAGCRQITGRVALAGRQSHRE